VANLSPRRIDDLHPQVQTSDSSVPAPSHDNDPSYVALRFGALHGRTKVALPFRGKRLTPDVGKPLIKGAFGMRRGSDGGIQVVLSDLATGELARYHVVSNGLHGVRVAAKIEPVIGLA